MLTYDRYLMPATLADALAALGGQHGNVRVLAGATDILPWAREGRAGDVHYDAVIDVTRVPELHGISIAEGRVRIGACTTIGQFLGEPLLRAQAPVLGRCAAWFADDQIREQATVGGNLVNASPAADATPALLALNAHVTLFLRTMGRIESRTMPLSEFIRGPGQNELRPQELLAAIEFDAVPAHGAAFEKVGHRRSLAISTACAAAVVRPDARRERFTDVRVAIGGVGPVAERLADAEAMLAGREITGELIREAASTAIDRVRSRTRVEYRREVAVNFVARAIARALEQTGVAAERLDYEETSHV